MTKVIQGPWKVSQSVEGDFLGIYPDTDKMEFPIAKMPEIVKPEINLARAKLIAAAPDLLRVAELLVDWLNEDEGAHKLCDTARAAILKATS